MTIYVTDLKEKDIPGAVKAVQEAFAGDPYNEWVYDHKNPANQPPTWNDWLESWRLYFGQVWMNLIYGRGGLNVKRYYIWKDAQAKAQSEVWMDPRGYYFLNIMVVLPEAQGKGVGAKMMKVVTEQADAEKMRCYLESSRDKPNVAIYGRFGFRLQKEMICDDDGNAIKLFTMIREPHAEPSDGR
ncbi:unnamed protein product [Fusarium langsethiae]|nr:unnamed protein product [Fusarium langsethiae]